MWPKRKHNFIIEPGKLWQNAKASTYDRDEVTKDAPNYLAKD